MSYYGFDKSDYPGDDVMQAWWTNSPFYFVGFYLAPAPHHTGTGWMNKRTTLKSQGWGFLPIYNGRQISDSNLTEQQGRTDAQNAATLARNAGFSYNTVIYLDIETGGTLPNNFLNYIKGWIDEIYHKTAEFYPGVYCSYSQTADQIKNYIGSSLGSITKFWVWNVNCPPSQGCNLNSTVPDPSGSGVSYARAWQYAQSPKPSGINCTGYSDTQCNKTYGGYPLSVDLDIATSKDPSVY